MYSLSSSKKSKYYVAAKINDNDRIAFIDSGADISLVPEHLVEKSKVKTISNSFTLKGFDNNACQTIDRCTELCLNFGNCTLKGKFFLCKTKFIILGCDILRDKTQNLNLETKTGKMTIDGQTVLTDHSPFEALQSLKIRIEQNQRHENTNCSTNWATLRKNVKIPPLTTTTIRLESDRRMDKNNDSVFMSLFDDENDALAIPSIRLSPGQRNFNVIAENRSNTAVTLSRGSRLGRLLVDGDTPGDDTVCAFDEDDISTAYAELIEEESTATAKSATAASAEASKSSEESTKTGDAVPLSSLIEENKIDASLLQKAHENGIEIDIELEIGEKPEFGFDNTVNIEEEMEKSAKCPYWPNDEQFLSKFKLEAVDHTTESELKQLLLKFKHVFYNEDTPSQFHEGIRVPPIKMRLKKDQPAPPKDRPRRMNDVKLNYLKEHLKKMKEKGIIREHTDYQKKVLMAPAHIVVESRYVASERKNIVKSRFVLDQRFTNQIIEPVSNTLPLCDEFRRNVAKEGYTVFSNLDAADFFYQFRTEYDDADFIFGFTALGRQYIMLRLSMGCTNSPGIAQAIIKRIFANHKNCEPFLDDLTVISKTMKEHIKADLPLALALCSKFNVLLKPTKADLARPNARILGFEISRSTTALSEEKLEKIRNLSFPETKKEALSRASFFAYFIHSVPKLSELMEPIRRLARPNVRFKPTDDDKKSFEALKQHLLDPKNGVIRMPSANLSDTIIVWTDSSQNSLGALITQKLYPLPHTPLDPTKKHLTIVGCWSRLIDPNWGNYPIWHLELLALEETTRKFRHLLEGRKFFVMTDSSTVKSWASLELVPVDISRRILRLQQFNFRILFIESRLNPSDWVTRLDSSKPELTFPRFLEERIVNANGEPMDWKELFCQKKFEEATGFFSRARRQNLAKATSREDQASKIEEIMGEQEDSTINISSQQTQKATRNPSKYLSPPSTTGRENQASTRHQSTSNSSKPSTSGSAHASSSKSSLRSSPKMSQPKKEEEQAHVRFSFDAIDDAMAAAFGLNDEDVEAGIDELLEDAPLDEDVFETTKLPTFDWEDLQGILKLQSNDKIIETITEFVSTGKPSPDKTAALALPLPIQQFLRHRSNFKLSQQNVLYRLWLHKDGTFEQLIVVGEQQFKDLVKQTHTAPTSTLKHLGKRKTFAALNAKYFAFKGRHHVQKIVAACPNCALNRFHQTRPEKTGNQISLEPNAEGAVDVVGPLASFGTSPSTGRPRYCFVYIDLHTRYVVAKPLTTIDDASIVDAFVYVRDALCGFPRRMMMDNAIAQKNSKSAAFLRERDVRIVHGLATISRCQSKVERAIQTLTRIMCKLHTENQKLSFTRIVAEACIIYNTSPSDGLPKNHSPKDLHFTKAPTSFPRHGALPVNTLGQALQAARLASKQTVLEDVKRYMKRQALTSPTDYSRKLKVGDLCLRKRTSFTASSPRKLAFRLNIDAYKITSKVATNSFRTESIIDGTTAVLPGDVLIKVAALTETELRKLVEEMEILASKNATLSAANDDEVDGEEPRRRRSARLRTRNIAESSPELACLFN